MSAAPRSVLCRRRHVLGKGAEHPHHFWIGGERRGNGYLVTDVERSRVFYVEPSGPLIHGIAAVLAILMTLGGSLRPAVRAAAIDPAFTIRTE